MIGAAAGISFLDRQGQLRHGFLDNLDEIEEQVAFNRRFLKDKLGISDHSKLAFIAINGDLMLPTLAEGDQILVDTDVKELISDGIYVLSDGNSARVKRLQKLKDNSILVMSDNKNYREETYQLSEHSALHIRGRVVWYSRKVDTQSTPAWDLVQTNQELEERVLFLEQQNQKLLENNSELSHQKQESQQSLENRLSKMEELLLNVLKNSGHDDDAIEKLLE